MLVFFDESGDNGFKIGQGSSRLLTVVMVVFEDNDEAQAVDDRIALLRHELGKSAQWEFHFVQNSHNIRRAFLSAVAPYNFFFFAFVIDKAHLNEGDFTSKESFYRYVCGLIFENAKPYLDNAIVKMDACGGREFRDELKGYLKKRLNDPSASRKTVKKVVTSRSQSNNLIQLADMICGAVARAQLGSRAKSDEFYGLIKHRQIWLRRWPEV